MRILVIHQYYLLPGQPGGSRFNEMARFWAEKGHRVEVIAGTLDYASGEIPAEYRGRWVKRERDGDVTVWRCHVPSSYRRSYLGRMWAFFGFTLTAALATLRAALPDVIIATSPPLVVAIPAWLAARLRGRRIPWVFEIRDLWPETAVTTGVLRHKSPLTRLLYWLERRACRTSDWINVLTPAFREDIVRRGLAADEKISFVPNGADIDSFRPGPRDNGARRRLDWGDRFVALYAGAHGRANALGQLVDAADRLRKRPDILIACVGDGPDREALEKDARRRGLDNIAFHGAWPKEQMPEVVNASDLGMAVLQRNPTFRTVYPNKVFDYMACARPTLVAIDGVARQLVCEDARAGVFVPPESPDDLAEAIRKMADDPETRARLGERGRAWVEANASREALAARYLSILSDLTGLSRSRGLRWWAACKGALDPLAAFVGLAVSLPLLAVLSLAVLVSVGRPILFRQRRLGLGGRPFTLCKFRTMTDQRDAEGRLLPDERRVTKIGRLLRYLRLDELPELLNVLRRDMNFVGPRPLLPEHKERYTPVQNRRLEVRPGLTGWAQVNGNTALQWDEKMALDVWYVDHCSWWLDALILLKTLSVVLFGERKNRRAITEAMTHAYGTDRIG